MAKLPVNFSSVLYSVLQISKKMNKIQFNHYLRVFILPTDVHYIYLHLIKSSPRAFLNNVIYLPYKIQVTAPASRAFSLHVFVILSAEKTRKRGLYLKLQQQI